MNPIRTSLGRPLAHPARCSATLLLALVVLSGCAGPWARPAILPASGETTTFFSPSDGGARGGLELAPRPAAAVAEVGGGAPLASSEPAAELAASEPTCPAAQARVLLVGDSLSAGLGPVMAMLARACGTSFHHHGVVGSHVTQWAEDGWLLPQLERAQPSVVVVSLGGNDFQRNDPAVVKAAVERFVAKVRARGARLLWIAPPTMPFDDAIDARGMWQQALGGEVERAWYPTETLDIPRTRDRVHPTLAGYRDLGATLWRWIAAAS